MDKLKLSLQSQVEGKVLVPGDEGYEESVKRWAGNFEKRAGYVVLVESSKDISKTVSLLSRLQLTYQKILWATKNNLELAVKCGGHSGTGASSAEGGCVSSARFNWTDL